MRHLGVDQPYMRDYLQRVVGDRGKTMITSVKRYESWADLPWDDTLPRPPLPDGPALLIGMRDVFLGAGHPGPEGFIALAAKTDIQVAFALADRLLSARRPGVG